MQIPHYTHDCDDCKFLGRFMDFDLYFCAQPHSGGRHIVLARDSNGGGGSYYTIYTRPEFYTGKLKISESSIAMFAAGQRAIALGYTTERELTEGYIDSERYDN